MTRDRLGEWVRRRTRELARANSILRAEIKDRRRKEEALRKRLVDSRGFIRDITWRVRLEQEIQEATERERRRIGRELHDDLCQQLTGIEFLSQSLARGLAGSRATAAARAREIAGMVRKAINHTRELAHGLAPTGLETGCLGGALRELCLRTRNLSGIDCRFHPPRSEFNRDGAFSVHLYRIAQEALANAVKHGRAKRVDIHLSHDRDRVELLVADNGIGIRENEGRGRGMGLEVMQYRAGVIGGVLSVAQNRVGGTSVKCTVNNGIGAATEKGRA